MYTGSPAPYVLSPLETPEPHGPHTKPQCNLKLHTALCPPPAAVPPYAPHADAAHGLRVQQRPVLRVHELQRAVLQQQQRSCLGKGGSEAAPPPQKLRGSGEGVRWMWGHLGGSGVTHLPAGAGRAIARPRELPDAGADSAAAAARTQLLLPQLHPAQRAHREALGQGGECESVGDVWGRGCGTEMVRGKGAGGWCGAAPAPQQSPDPSLPQSVQPRALGADPTDGRG